MPSVTCLLWLSVPCRKNKKGGVFTDGSSNPVVISRFTVLFEEPFWVGIYEREFKGRCEVCKITFGAEPKDYEVYDFLLKNWHRLRFSPSVETEIIPDRHVNPKRMQRIITKQLNTGIGTKAQQALKLQQQEGKQARKIRSREQREEEKERLRRLHRQKNKEKHRGH
ncbi:MAG: YjdF family protein [Clostridiales bacterium]|nr:YjdF family protein [Clostridiales bacterium]